MIAELPRPVAIVCHDAGGANHILALLNRSRLDGVTAYMEGPARALWEKTLPRGLLANDLTELLRDAGALISGTGWASDLEHNARKVAKMRRIYSIAALDHWINYSERFVRDGETVLPDELWVFDEYALNTARYVFPYKKITQIPDFYAEEQISKILPLTSSTPNELVYLLEPIRSDWGRGEAGEFQALRFFFEYFPRLALPRNTLVRLRPHPSDSPNKYDAFLTSFGPDGVAMDHGDLAQALSQARWVAGCQTYAMTLALKAGRTVYCSLPPWAPPCKLPQQGFIHIKNLSHT